MGQQQTFQAQEQRYNQNYTDALADNRVTEERLNEREMEENASYVQKDQMSLIEGAEKQAQVRSAAATGGVAGNSVQSTVNEIGTQINFKRGTLQQQWQASLGQTESEKLTAVDQEEARIGEVAPPTSPSPVGSVLSVAGAGLSYGSTDAGKSFFGGLSGGGGSGASSGINVIPAGSGMAVSP